MTAANKNNPDSTITRIASTNSPNYGREGQRLAQITRIALIAQIGKELQQQKQTRPYLTLKMRMEDSGSIEEPSVG
jgi:hypothetical protein